MVRRGDSEREFRVRFCPHHVTTVQNNELLPLNIKKKTLLQEKEEHLSPPPYQTRCRDSRPSKDAKESTNPGSYEANASRVAVLTKNMASSVGERGVPFSPPPYQTRCRDNRPSKDAKESINPSSYEVNPSQVAVLRQNVASLCRRKRSAFCLLHTRRDAETTDPQKMRKSPSTLAPMR
ncbi:hypothetical protein AVEN_145553-1 [Araneus ventricosus]|uniref:Uncharacterized protein n=1 Tax=Araneus ventricosus TaxID=182803 RepID=A0A4Y2UZW0_ARAVE|nr:hypothetical protein AVEN_139019-1 [Araneus ventricosus]GBO17190.1 hypothetical protein AVEN_26356-1 [Araneus ventricosus]GBO17197.1 hypothetical protein AVEN_145553-1 [Araneus ventricosus]